MNNNTDALLVSETASIEEALVKIDINTLGIVFVADGAGSVVGCVTDGDIRRQLLANHDMSVAIGSFMLREFTWAASDASREYVLKLLDHRVRIVPVLDKARRLVKVCTRESFQLEDEVEVFARAR